VTEFSPLGVDLFGQPIARADHGKAPPLAERFTFPPFSVLDARGGEWQDRKRAWIATGIESEIGRSGVRSDEHVESASLKGLTHGISCDAYARAGEEGSAAAASGVSIFDPVLCEMAYRWFSPSAGSVIDPFAGGSVRGIVAGMLGRAYDGVDLSAEQCAANQEQKRRLCGEASVRWHNGDSAERLPSLAKPGGYDFALSCPPYFNLEVYSDHLKDLSAMPWADFVSGYRDIISKTAGLLKSDAFAMFVVGDIRDERGLYRDLPGETTRAFLDAGMSLYNEAVLVTAVGSLSLRAGRSFAATRKLGKAHQNVLVYVKGDPRKAADAVSA